MPIDYSKPLHEPEALKKRRKTPSKREKSLKEELKNNPTFLIEALQALGFQVSLPTTEEARDKQVESLSKLGFALPEVVYCQPPQTLRTILYVQHFVGGNVYGPGELELPLDQSTLFNSLLQADRSCVKALMDIKEYSPISKCFVIEPSSNTSFKKKEVSQAYFDSDQLFNGPGITVGKHDIAGYHPEGQENRPF